MKRSKILIILILVLTCSCKKIGKKVDSDGPLQIVVSNRPQNPKPPYPYSIKDVSYYNMDKSIRFGGTLTIPDADYKHPVAILITGSGQQDRDETLFGHKPFWIIADYLTRKGIAVLRVDDRGVGSTSGNETLENATSYDFAMDVIAAIEFLKKQKNIDPSKIGLIGHSEGSIIASILGAERNDIAFIVSMAGLGISGKDFALSQTKTRLQRHFPSHTTDSILTFESKVIDIINAVKSNQLATEQIIKLYDQRWLKSQDSITQAFFGFQIIDGFQTLNIANTLEVYKKLMIPWNRYLLSLNPELIYPQIKAPFLAVNGEKDKQVLADMNLNGIKTIFDKCRKTNYDLIKYAGLNHFFQHCESGYYEEISSIEETISEDFLHDMTEWIKEQLKNNNNP